MAETEQLPEEFLEAMAEVIRLIGHPVRLRILEYLDLHGESTVNEIISGCSGQQSAVSQHLNRMRLAGIVSCRRDGRQIFYRIAAVNAVTILNCLRSKYRSLRESGSPAGRS